jgi:hypothetical protein
MALRNDGNEAQKIPLSEYVWALQPGMSLGIFSRMIIILAILHEPKPRACFFVSFYIKANRKE